MKGEKKDWTISSPVNVIRKRNYHIFTVSEQATNDEYFLAILDKHDIQVKKFFWYYIRFEDESNPWIPEEDAIGIKK